MWKGLAEQQKRRREETERDNVLLRLAVERQTKVADSLRSLMQKRAVQLVRRVCSTLSSESFFTHLYVRVCACVSLADE